MVFRHVLVTAQKNLNVAEYYGFVIRLKKGIFNQMGLVQHI